MNLEKVALKIEKILNGTDEEIGGLSPQPTNPTDFLYEVETTGFHLDHIMNRKQGQNFIPVFISSMGGNMNPVPNLKQGNYNVPIIFYFPVRFKNEMFKLYDYLVDCFVGRSLTFGEDRCICNLSVPTYGEIQELDLKAFKTWVENKYQEQIEDINAPYITMQVSLYLTNAASGFVYGNDIHIQLTIEGSTVEAEEIVFASGTLQANSQALSEQEEGQDESEAIPTSTTTAVSFSAYYKDNDFFNEILTHWINGTVQELRLTAKLYFGDPNDNTTKCYERYAFVESLNMPIRKGELLTITFSLARAIDYREPVGE